MVLLRNMCQWSRTVQTPTNHTDPDAPRTVVYGCKKNRLHTYICFLYRMFASGVPSRKHIPSSHRPRCEPTHLPMTRAWISHPRGTAFVNCNACRSVLVMARRIDVLVLAHRERAPLRAPTCPLWYVFEWSLPAQDHIEDVYWNWSQCDLCRRQHCKLYCN